MGWTLKSQTPRPDENDVLLTFEFADPDDEERKHLYEIAANAQTDTKHLTDKVEACYQRWLETDDTHPKSPGDEAKMTALKAVADSFAGIKQTSGKG